ncbi:hypothetical protein [Erysipelothrix aquatica]|uniref:hypothetical protein n=1 Tax=Erysipelothrix aquatica TaxID=2683714 RepID=UPI00135ABEFA|nr:hypothetical protein [Erysipelothrix aquatica]
MNKKIEAIKAVEMSYQETIESLSQVYDDIVGDYRHRAQEDCAKQQKAQAEVQKQRNAQAVHNAESRGKVLHAAAQEAEAQILAYYEAKKDIALNSIIEEVFAFGDC